MRIFLILLLALGFVSQSTANTSYEYERVINYHSDVFIQNDCRVLVKEKIKVYANGGDIKRGIFRELPLSYRYQGGNFHVGFELVSLTRNGKSENYHTENVSNGIRIYTGSENVFLTTGVHEYELTYIVDHVLSILDDVDELYWNVNGNGWLLPIDSLSANVYLPDGATMVRDTAHTGKRGETGNDYKSWEIEGGMHFESTQMFFDSENLSFAISWDKGHMKYPTKWDNFLHWLKTYVLFIVGGIGILFAFLSNFILWWKYGRDPKPGTIIPLYYPPKGMSPAECAYLKKAGKQDKEMFGANLISLAVKRYLNINATETAGKGSKKEYTLTKSTEREKKELTEIEQSFLIDLMGSKDSLIIKEGKYNARVASAAKKLNEDIDAKQKDLYYKRNRHLSARTYFVPGIFAIILFTLLYFYGGNPFIPIMAVALQIMVSVLFIRLLEQPTAEGRKKMDEIAGFEMYLKYADKERIRLTNPPTMNFAHFEENLAYAMALGVAEEWEGQFEAVEIQDFKQGRLPYYHGLPLYSMSGFSSQLSSAISSASIPPSSSGSSFSGGGGFSGGGFGGGGGGGW